MKNNYIKFFFLLLVSCFGGCSLKEITGKYSLKEYCIELFPDSTFKYR
jgi:hypothetical protein